MSDRYFKNANGGIVAMSDETYDEYYSVEVNGNRYPFPGWSELSANEARAARPQLWGAPDPNVKLTAVEAKAAQEQLLWEDAAAAKAAAVAAGEDATAASGKKE
jgi:hypothetical protein